MHVILMMFYKQYLQCLLFLLSWFEKTKQENINSLCYDASHEEMLGHISLQNVLLKIM